MEAEIQHLDTSRFNQYGPINIWVLPRYQHRHDMAAHDHEFLEIVFVQGGRAKHQLVTGSSLVGRGNILILKPGIWHAYQRCSEFRYINLVLGMEFLRRELYWTRSDSLLSPLLWEANLDTSLIEAAKLPDEQIGDCESQLAELETLLQEAPSSGQHCKTVSIVFDLLGTIAKGTTKRLAAEQRARPALFHPATRKAVKLMESDITQAWQLPELASRCELNESYLCRIFKRNTGLSPMEYLKRLRLERASTLLLSTNKQITEIAYELGFGDCAHFSRSFKKLYKRTPSELRQQMLTTSTPSTESDRPQVSAIS